VYRVSNVRVETLLVYTNTVPAGNMRAPGGIQVALAGEGHIDHIARSLGLDPLEFRLRNALRSGDSGPAGERIRHPRAEVVLEALRQATRWGQTALPPGHGRGLALRRRGVGEGKTSVALRLVPGGQVEVLLGVPDQGGGAYTAVRRVAAAALSVRPERIVPRYGTTAEALADPGAGGSRVTHVVGRAAIAGALQLRARLEELAAEAMGWPAGRVRLEQDRFTAGDRSAESAAFETVAERVLRAGPVEVQASYDSADEESEAGRDYSFYACMVEVSVDPETGQVRPVEAVAAVDVGTIVNPVAHQGQLEGGFVFGLGNALSEELAVEDGKVTTASLGEYKLPTAADIPALRTILLSAQDGPGPFGAKAVGELANSAIAPAIANAVYDAVGARVKSIPITAERVLAALREQPSGRVE
jgi:carbon-monoxide dehydrogenase large subunit